MADRKAGGSGLVLVEVRKCSCKSEFQDGKYGPQMWLHRAVPEKNGNGHSYRCTVCEDTRAQKRGKMYAKGQSAGAVGRLS